jgi:hypothetical protein
MGSGLPENFTAYVDDVRIGFGGTNPIAYSADVQVTPIPSVAAAAPFLFGLLGLGRRSRR